MTMKTFPRRTDIRVLFVAFLALCVMNSCQQAINLDTDRTVTATNLPEITDVSPKIVWFGDRVTIIGKNFVNVEKVQLGSVILDSVRVVSPAEIRAVVPPFSSTLYYQQLIGKRLLAPFSVIAKLGTASFKYPIAWSANRVQGFATLNGNPLDSILSVLTHTGQGRVVSPSFNETGQGYFTASVGNFSPSVQAGEELILRPFLSGYRFTPLEARVRTTAIGGTDLIVLGSPEFTATQVPAEQLPRVQTLSPTMATIRVSGDVEIVIIVQGSNLSGIRQVFLQEDGVVGSPLRRNIAVQVHSDTQITVRFSTSSSPFWRNIVRHHKLYLIGDNASQLTTQRFTIVYNP